LIACSPVLAVLGMADKATAATVGD